MHVRALLLDHFYQTPEKTLREREREGRERGRERGGAREEREGRRRWVEGDVEDLLMAENFQIVFNYAAVMHP